MEVGDLHLSMLDYFDCLDINHRNWFFGSEKIEAYWGAWGLVVKQSKGELKGLIRVIGIIKL